MASGDDNTKQVIQFLQSSVQFYHLQSSPLLSNETWNTNQSLTNDNPIQLQPESSMLKLNFPSGICVDNSTQRIFVADSANHRILIINQDGSVFYQSDTD